MVVGMLVGPFVMIKWELRNCPCSPAMMGAVLIWAIQGLGYGTVLGAVLGVVITWVVATFRSLRDARR
jgi:ABC-type branched-subunit amino acid transport system permease subunit